MQFSVRSSLAAGVATVGASANHAGSRIEEATDSIGKQLNSTVN
ncbi:hypothetical protein M2272_005826 [Mycobacterium frederiksbergense]|uniref:Uncharacterized protein n=1 Tax=Mycolicibacterium frederiksbergense TaxID=117567 RepID=A0ABT6L8F4_9MYCO|nr:hypothetical protein [Mycolicibacterium frederiksbergense]